jgi:2-C-methyl-D-erythritol 2,4-cyclodiphosphate synthase
MRDIGYQYPDNNMSYKGIDSKELLKDCIEKIKTKGYTINNIDSTICLQTPKIGKHIPEMQKCLAEVMGIDIEDISIKATTTEKLGFVGKSEGISAYAVCLITK